MEKVTIDAQILNQIDRQIDLAYWLSGIIIALAVFVIGYQIFINKNTIKQMKKENADSIKKTAKELLKISLQTSLKLGGFSEPELRSYLEIYSSEIGEDDEILNLLKHIKFNTISSQFVNVLKFDYSKINPVDDNLVQQLAFEDLSKEEIMEILNNLDYEESKEYKKKVICEIVISINKLFNEYGIK